MKKLWEVYGDLEAIVIQAAILSGYYARDSYEMAEQIIAELKFKNKGGKG